MAVLAKEAVAVEQVYITDELYSRAPKITDYKMEKLALQDLARQMVSHSAEVLPRLVDLAMEICDGISGGISLYEDKPSPDVFRWHHLRGNLEKFTGATTPRNFSPCGVTLDLNKAVLVKRPERVYTWLVEANVSLAECLLVPLYVGGSEPLGTLWIVSEHEGHFDSGHARVMTELASFAGIALHMVESERRLTMALEEQETLAREMSHRLKNLFSIVGGMIRVSERQSSTPAEMAQVLGGRLNALAGANALVRRGFDDKVSTQGADLGELVRTILLPHDLAADETRYTIDGPAVRVGDHATNGIALILHEFATNAAKYGALKSDGGVVTVSWKEVDSRLLLNWEEHGGPEIAAPPDKIGFGTKLTQSTVVGQFHGALTYDWRREGLKVTVSVPMANLAR